ncbi:uncharacterized protein MELLADRAFT_71947 [Melampsora larici-populina 98AG31]|uniref:Uncharacterized protein n=1 Tax=Melampsora larici-populina (strain 98AG31 / pathotype 3-4-7) TaxID=747676 RepID=F4RMT2_MELLP|nr:uncharacterized protein MELLADRAFT_71947 [Melampsora larici-populina 98AG31]EGG06325.1 hypothetical protein MELLADRAFT_71947 [Melampsora larici-populina 98AG31]
MVDTGVTKIAALLRTLPPDINAYAALIPYIYAQASARNPTWMSFILIVFLLAHISIMTLATLVLINHIQSGHYWFMKKFKSGLLKPDRVLVESIGSICYAALTIVDMSCQLYTDIAQRPVRGKLFLEWYRWPIVGFMLWCIMWGTIANRVRAFWDPTFREDSNSERCGMPSWVINLLNGIFVFWLVVNVPVLCSIYIPAYRRQTDIFNTLDRVTEELLLASTETDTLQFSWAKLEMIISPLERLPELYQQFASAFLKTHYAFFVLDFTLMTIYMIFVYLTYRQYKTLHKSPTHIPFGMDPNRSLRFTYREEIKALFIEAGCLCFWLASYMPVFVWTVAARSGEDLLLSPQSVIVPELSLASVASVVGNIVLAYRLASTKRMLAYKKTPIPLNPVPHGDLKMQDRKSEADCPHEQQGSPTSYTTRVKDDQETSSTG